MLPSVKSAAIPGGVLEYVEQGSGLPVVLLPGYSDSWRSFASVLPHLPETLRAIALSQRGHGDSYRPASGYRARHFAGDLAAFLDTLGIDQAVIVGHSLGTQVAQRFAIEHPERTLGLVLIGGYPTMRSNLVVQELWASTIQALSDPVDPAFVTEFQLSTLAQPVPDGWLDMAVAESLKVPARIWREICEGLLQDDTFRDLERVTAETLILWGERDAICSRADQAALAACIARSRMTIYQGAGHAPHWEEPARVAADLVTFTQEQLLAAA
jgi:pimeloyl-ACP methyl ester carboxylesterase